MDNIKNSLLKNLTSSSFIRGTFILFMASMTMNALFFLFQIYVGKLGPEQSGLFGTLTYLIYLLIIPLTTGIQTIISKYASTFSVSKDYGKMHFLFSGSTKRLLLLGLIFSMVFIAFSSYIANFLHIDSIISLILVDIVFMLSLVLSISRGMLQGLQNFKALGINFVLEGLFKFVLGIIFIELGFGVNGAIIAIIISYLIPWIVAYFSFRKIINVKSEKFDTKELYKYSFPVFITTLLLTAFYSIDVLLVRHYLNEIQTGLYWAASLLAKIVFFASSSIALVLFPQVNELSIKNLSTRKILVKAISLVALISTPILLVYYLIPRLILKIIGFDVHYSEITSYLGLFGLIMAIFSLVYVISFYNLSLRRMNFVYLLGIFIIAEAILIALFHSSILEILSILLTLISFLFISITIITLIRK